MFTRSLGVLCFLTVFAMAIGVGRPLPAQEADEDSAGVLKLDRTVTRFLDSLHGDDQAKAFDELLKGSQLSRTSDDYKTLLSRAKEIEKTYGKYQESERVSVKKIGKDLVLLKYLFKCEKFPVVWYFTYYRDFNHSSSAAEDENWVIIAVKFDTQLDSLEL